MAQLGDWVWCTGSELTSNMAAVHDCHKSSDHGLTFTLQWNHLLFSLLYSYSHEIKRRSLLGRKVMTNLDSLLKSRDIILPIKVHLVKAMVFPVVMYGCESWIVKKAECWTDAFELWCWRRLLRAPWTARTSNQSILKEINPEYSLKGLILKLKSFATNEQSLLIGKDPDAGKDWGQRRRVWQRVRWLDRSLNQWTWIWASWDIVEDRGAWCPAVCGVAQSWTWLSNWTAMITTN